MARNGSDTRRGGLLSSYLKAMAVFLTVLSVSVFLTVLSFILIADGWGGSFLTHSLC